MSFNYSAIPYLTRLSSEHLPLLGEELENLGVPLKNAETDYRTRSTAHHALSGPVLLVDNSRRSSWNFGGWGSTTVVHHHHHHAVQTSRPDHRKQERMVALGVFTAIAATILSYLVGRSYNALSDAKTTRDAFARYTCQDTIYELQYSAIERAVASIVVSRTWAIIDRVALVAGLILVTVGAFTPLMPLVALGGTMIFAGALSEAFRFGIYGLEGRQQKQIKSHFSLLEKGMSREARSPDPSAPLDECEEGLYPRVDTPSGGCPANAYPYGQAVGQARLSGSVYGQPVRY